jgi:hypothetical protein
MWLKSLVVPKICFGKQRQKTVKELAKATKLSPKRILEEGRRLSNNQIVEQIKTKDGMAYRKDNFYAAHKDHILSLADNPKKLANFPTKVTPKIIGGKGHERISINRKLIFAEQITVDSIQSFEKVKKIKFSEERKRPISEARFKKGVQAILGEKGKFQDWGGEKNDLLTTRLLLSNKRVSVAFAFKGPGQKGRLTPGKMGKNGDQIQRLFSSPAKVFLLQYHGQVEDSVFEQMKKFAMLKSVFEGKIYYGIIDGQDSSRLMKAYQRCFN